MIPDQEIAHVGTGKGKLIEQFKKSSNVLALLGVFLKQCQEVEDMLWDIIEQRSIDASSGVLTDNLGALVGEPREGRSDAEYKVAIRLRIRVNRSNGTSSDMREISDLIYPGCPYLECFPAAFLLEMFDLDHVRSVSRLIGESRMAGVQGALAYTTWSDDSFRFSDDAMTVPDCRFSHTDGSPTSLLWAVVDTKP